MNGTRPAWREPLLWLVLGIPLATLIAGLLTLRIASVSGAMDAAPEAVRRTAQTQTTDLAADALAARLGLSAGLLILPTGEVTITTLAPTKAAAVLDLRMIHPHTARLDLLIRLRRDGKVWRGQARIDPAPGWRVQLQDEQARWRLVARLAPGQRHIRLQPALATP